MSDSRFGDSGKHGSKKKAKTGYLEDGPSSFRASHSPPWQGMENIADGGMENIPDGGIEDSGDVIAWKKLEEYGKEEEEEMDPMMVFGSGIMMIILGKLDARSVAQARLVSRDWRTVASSDKIWAPKGLFHMFRNGILNGDPIQIYFMLFCMEDMIHRSEERCLANRGIDCQRFCFTFVYACYKVIGRNKEEISVFHLMSWSLSVNQQEIVVCMGSH